MNIKPKQLIKTTKKKFFKVNPSLIISVEDIESVRVVPAHDDLFRIVVYYFNKSTDTHEYAFFQKRNGNDMFCNGYAYKVCGEIYKELTL